MGWSRAGISFTAVLNFLAMGFGSFLWGSLSDRFGTRAVVLCGGVLLGLGLIAASHAPNCGSSSCCSAFWWGSPAGSFYAPLIATITRWFTANRSLAVALVSAGMGIGTLLIAPLSRWIITQLRLAHRDADDWLPRLARRPAPPRCSAPPACACACGGAAARSRWTGTITSAQVLRTPQFAAIALTHFACCAAHSGPIFHMVSYAIDCGVSSMTAATVFGIAGLAALSGRIVCGLMADRVGAKRTLIAGLRCRRWPSVSMWSPRAPSRFYVLAACSASLTEA